MTGILSRPVENNNSIPCGVWLIGCDIGIANDVDIVMRVHSCLNNLNTPPPHHPLLPGLKRGPGPEQSSLAHC